MKRIDLEISIDEVNLILEALGEQPFIKVYGLIGKIQDQAKKQLEGDIMETGAGAESTPAAFTQ